MVEANARDINASKSAYVKYFQFKFHLDVCNVAVYAISIFVHCWSKKSVSNIFHLFPCKFNFRFIFLLSSLWLGSCVFVADRFNTDSVCVCVTEISKRKELKNDTNSIKFEFSYFFSLFFFSFSFWNTKWHIKPFPISQLICKKILTVLLCCLFQILNFPYKRICIFGLLCRWRRRKRRRI